MSAIFDEPHRFPQEKGPDVELVVSGDEFYSRRETKDGYTVIYDNELGLYCYATLQEGRFISSQVSISEHPPSSLQPHLEEAESMRREKFSARYDQLRPLDHEPISPQSRGHSKNRSLNSKESAL